MAQLDSKHVTWGGLQYYHSLITNYVDDLIANLKSNTLTPEEALEIRSKLETVLLLITNNTAKIEELFNVTADNRSNIDKLLMFDKTNTENIAELQTRLEFAATKEDLATLEGELKVALDDLLELENKIETDHITLENIRIALENFATEEDIAEITTNVTNITEQVKDIQATYVTNTYITENYTTTQELEATYVTKDKVTEVVTEQIETKVTEVIQAKVDEGEIIIPSLSYGSF